MKWTILIWALLLAIILTAAQVLFKLFATARGDGLWLSYSRMFPLAGALLLYFIVFVLYAYILRKFELALLYPTYTGLSILLTFASGVLLFKEQVSIRAFVGCLLLILSIYLIAAPTGGRPGG